MLTSSEDRAVPISDREALAWFSTWLTRSPRPIVLAISGGPDSMAMMHLAAIAATELRHRGQPCAALHVATVDHGLRDASRDEAVFVKESGRALGLSTECLIWQGEKPATGIQEAARTARYRLLRQHAERLGAETIMTAHTLDDQAETVLLRLARGSGPRGLAAMRRESPMGAQRLARPLLGVAKARLVATCQANRWDFIDDPSNRSDRFTRVRLRHLLTTLGGEGLTVGRLVRLGERMQRVDDALEEQARQAFARLQETDQEAGISFSAADFAAEGEECRIRLITMALGSVRADPAVAVRLERIEVLSQRLSLAHGAGKQLRTTCAGSLIVLSRGKITFAAEGERHRGRKCAKPSVRAQLGFSASAP